MMFPKTKPFRSRRYLNWVASQPCAMCQAPADEAHHLIGIGGYSGMGTKAPDDLSIPACRSCHEHIHARPELIYGQWENIARTLHRAICEGVFVEGSYRGETLAERVTAEQEAF
nr:hypothetical protein [uncultured Halomonas sp.]